VEEVGGHHLRLHSSAIIATLGLPILDDLPFPLQGWIRREVGRQRRIETGRLEQDREIVGVAIPLRVHRREIILPDCPSNARFQPGLDGIAGQVVGAVEQPRSGTGIRPRPSASRRDPGNQPDSLGSILGDDLLRSPARTA
jgi:hypothetical protein